MYGKRIRELREERGISMMALANAIGVSDTAVCKWENQVSEPKLTYIVRLADFFGCSADYLVGHTEENANACGRFDPSEQKLINLYRSVPCELQDLLLETLSLWCKQ